MVCKSQYCGYRHFAGELRGSAADCFIPMFTTYFDDSGTDGTCDIAIAACYVSTKRGWDEFVEEWDIARAEEGFECFHMSDFVAPSFQGKKPWCDWDKTKKTRVYNRLARIINENKRTGIALAVPKTIYDAVPERIKHHYGRQHYTFAVRICLNRIIAWRSRSGITLPMRYTFDWEMQQTPKREEINKIFDLIGKPKNKGVADLLGLEASGYGFEHKEEFKPLQSADILAWQMRSHMRKIWQLGHDEESLCHPGFRLLRQDQEMDLGFFTKENMDAFVVRHDTIDKIEPFPQVYD